MDENDSQPGEDPIVEGVDYTIEEDGNLVFTAHYLKRRGYCCHQGCRNCPYEEPTMEPPR